MKRIAGILLILLLALLGCAAPEQPVEDPTAVLAPEPSDVTLTLPLRRNGETSTALKAFTAGFADPKGMPMTFRATSADTDVAICALSDDGTLFISAAGIGETALTVSGFASDGRSADTTVAVKVTDDIPIEIERIATAFTHHISYNACYDAVGIAVAFQVFPCLCSRITGHGSFRSFVFTVS